MQLEKRRFRRPSSSELAVALVCLLAALVLIASLADNDYWTGILGATAGLVAAGQYLNYRVVEPRRQQRRRDAALRSYLRELRQDCMHPPFPTTRRLRKRPDFYVAPSPLEPLGGPSEPSVEMPPARDVEEALSMHEHVLLEGEPGVGKSAMLDRLVVRLIDRLDSLEGDGLVPVRVPAAVVAASGKPLSLALSDAVNVALGMRLKRALEPDFFEQRPAKDRRWLVVLDGLDELVGAAGRVHFMRGVANNLESYRFVVATRPLNEATRVGWERFGRYRLPDFSKAQAKEFIETWFLSRPSPAFGIPPAEGFLRSLEAGSFGQEIGTNPLLLLMAAAEWEQAPTKPLTARRADLYERFVTMFVEDLELERAARAQFRRDWAAFGDEAEQLADRLFDHRRGLLDLVAAQHDKEDVGDYGRVVAEWVRRVGGEAGSRLLRRLDDGWLTEQADNLLESTGLARVASGRVEFLHETFREYLVARAFSTEHSPVDWPAWEFVARHWHDFRRQMVLFAASVWAEADEDATELVARLRHAMGGYAAAAVLVEGVKVDDTLRARVLEDFLYEVRRNSTNSSMWGSGNDHLAMAERLAKSPHDGGAVLEGLSSIARDKSSIIQARVEILEALARLGRRDDAIEGLRALREEARGKAVDDPLAGFGCVRVASALDALGEREEAVDFLRQLGARRPDIDWSVETQSSVIGRMVRAEAAKTLESLGERADAIAVVSDIARDPSSDPVSRSMAAVGLEGLASTAEAVYAEARIAQDSMERPSNRVNACERLDRLGERHLAVTAASEIARDPQNPRWARIDAAALLHRLGENRQAITALTGVLDPDPVGRQSGEARFKAAKLLLQLGGPEDVPQALDALAHIADDSGTPGYVRTEAAEILGTHDRRSEAVALLRVFTEGAGVWVWDRLRAVEALWRLGEHAGLQQAIRAIIRDGDASNRTLLLDHAATALDSITQPGEGTVALREVADDPAAEGTLRVDAAEVAGWRGDLRWAIDFQMSLTEDSRSTASTRSRAAESACTLGEYRRSLPLLWEIVEAHETDSTARRAAAWCLVDQDHVSIAAPRLFEICINSDLPEEDRLGIAKVLETRGHARILPAEDAIPILEAIISDPDMHSFPTEGVEPTLRTLREQGGVAILPAWVVDSVEDP